MPGARTPRQASTHRCAWLATWAWRGSGGRDDSAAGPHGGNPHRRPDGLRDGKTGVGTRRRDHRSHVPHDEAVFGGTRDQVMRSVTSGGPGLVAVGSAGKGGDHDAIVWTSPDGLNWSRVAHDEKAFGGESIQVMQYVTIAPSGLRALGLDGPFDASSAAVWISPGWDQLVTRAPRRGASRRKG